MQVSETQSSVAGSLLTIENPRHTAPPDWALRVGELIELLTDAQAENDWQLVVQVKSLLENMQAELVNELERMAE